MDSEAGSGTTVRIYFPLASEPAGAVEPAAAEQARYRGTECILLVEDEPEVRRLASEMLSRLGYRVLEASSGAEAIRIWRDRRESVNLLLTDIIMPRMSGRELAETLQASRPNLAVLYMSGYADDVIARHGVLDSSTALVQKPFTADTLARKVRAALDRKE